MRCLTERGDSNALVKGFCLDHGRWKHAGSGTGRDAGRGDLRFFPKISM